MSSPLAAFHRIRVSASRKGLIESSFAQIASRAMQLGLLLAGLGIFCQSQVHAQNASLCESRAASSGRRVVVSEVNFSGGLQLPATEQESVASSIKKQTFAGTAEDARDEALERVRYGWQNRGYFRAQVEGEARVLGRTSNSESIALDVHVDEGRQYVLRDISFQHNHGIYDLALLRNQFAIQDGAIFSRKEITTGLENLRKLYGHNGYINFTLVPNTEIDERDQSIALVIDVDEGKVFHIGSVNVTGLDDVSSKAILAKFRLAEGPGGIVDRPRYETLLEEYASNLPTCDCQSQSGLVPNERTGIADINLDFRPCSER